jgi:RHS repeat-associated protein
MVLRALYLYDGAERRVTRTVIPLGKTWFYAYDGWEEVQEMAFATQTVPEKQFVWGKQIDELVAYRWKPAGAWTSYFIAEGGAHCPVKVLDSAGVVREIQEYDSYGKTTFYPVGGGAYGDSLYGNPFRWKGHRVDLETGLVCMRHRYYSPRLGRFVSQDPLGVWADMATGGNSYSYGRGNPLTDTDRSGLQVAVAGSNLLGFFSTPAGLEASFGDGTSLLLTPGAGDAGSQIQLLEEVGSAAEARTAWEAEFAKVLGEEFARQMFLQEVSENAERLMNSCLEGWIGLKLLTEMGGGSGRVMSTGLTEGELRSLATAYSNAMSRMAAGLGVQANGARVGLNGRQLWGRADTLDDHFLRHGADFGARNADDYAQQASDFFRRSQADSLPTKIDPDGTIRVYDRASNTFGAYNASGTTRTFYKPDPATHGYPTNLDYWNAQPGSAPWMPK